MKCQNCNKNMKKVVKPTVYVDEIESSEGLMKVTWERRWKCSTCDVRVGVAVKTELIDPKPALLNKKPPTKRKEKRA